MSLNSFHIDKIEISPNLILAPMSGVTNRVFRQLVKSENPGAVGLLVTEFISIEALTRGNQQSVDMMKYVEAERPISVQIFGHDIGRMVSAAKMVEDAGADILDINCGCPVPKVVKKGGGCELMRQTEHLGEILTAVRAAISIPLTLKIRSGWDVDSKNGVAVAKMAENCGVAMLAVHGRTRTELYRGKCDWSFIEEVVNAVSIPVVGSGDVVDFPSAEKAFESGVAAVMIGRGAMANPWIFSEIRAGFERQRWERRPYEDIVGILEKYRDMLVAEMHEKAVMGRLKQLTSQVTRQVPGSQQARRVLCSSKNVDEFSKLLLEWREFLRTRSKSLPPVDRVVAERADQVVAVG
ncbi:hypothetical protein BVY02_00190 [bacterium J17]|nr:hypothetical protein BVY02_00190 [bacterium J17]